ncbi:MAG: imidazole glycerol phosphate synthase subunit HisH [Thermodesulfovibrionales bacterium]|nr:imidazole glycerol phosphate synthase subunit HisH [Thermodesulfovibrionales bacterium]
MIAVIDYGMGNLRSVEKGFAHVGVDARIVDKAQALEDAEGIVLPGVGAFRDCMSNLEKFELAGPIVENIKKGKPFLGICLGLQLLFTESGEFGHTKGLDVFKGNVPRFPENELKVPHMGWNSINIKNRPPILEGVPENSYFYFVHSYYVAPEDESIVATTTDYGVEFTSMIWKDNVFATQFHPEKSQALGLQVLKNFGEFVKKN